jgi:hypothetical protein
MDAHRIEIVVCSAAIAGGVMLAVFDPERLPTTFRSSAIRLGRYRQAVGGAVILVGLTLVFLVR